MLSCFIFLGKIIIFNNNFSYIFKSIICFKVLFFDEFGLQLREPNFFDKLPATNLYLNEKIHNEELEKQKDKLEAIFRDKVFPMIPERQRKILKLRFGFYDEGYNPNIEEHTLEEIGKKLD